MKKAINYLFFIYYSWSSNFNHSFPQNTALVTVVALTTANIMELNFLLAYLFDYQETFKSFGFTPFLLLGGILMFYGYRLFVRNQKHIQIAGEFSNETKKEVAVRNIIGWAYIIFTVVITSIVTTLYQDSEW